MKFYTKPILVGLLLTLGMTTSLNAMEIIFGRKYPIQQNANKDQLSWLSVTFEKDLTGKVLYKLEASHPQGKKISYLKGRDYLLSEEIQKSLVRNFEVKMPEVEFDTTGKATYEIVLPYDFQTRYLPLKFEKDGGYQEVVLRLRFGDYRFMLASRTLNTVANVDNIAVSSATTVEQLFAKRSLLKARPDKVEVKEEIVAVNVDDIYDLTRQDLNIKSRIVTDVSQMAATETKEEVMDEFDVLINQYLPDEKQAKEVVAVKAIEVKTAQAQNVSDEAALLEKQLTSNPASENDYNAYVEGLIKDEKKGEFGTDASVDDIIAQADQFGKIEEERERNKKILNMDEEQLEQYLSSMDENGNPVGEIEEQAVAVQPKKEVYIPPVDTEALFGLPSDDWVEPKSAPILVMKPKPVDQKRRVASFEAPKRNNFVEMTPPPKSAPPPTVNMDDLFGGSGADSNGLGF